MNPPINSPISQPISQPINLPAPPLAAADRSSLPPWTVSESPACCAYHQSLNQTPRKLRSLSLALGLLLSLAGLEVGAAWMSHSVALLAEAGHLLTDGLALGLALLAVWIGQWPSSSQATFGYRRIEILAALLNGVGLLGLAIWISWEAIDQWSTGPIEIWSQPMLITAAIGLGVNLINVKLLHPDSQQDLNLRGAWLHMLADLASAIGVMLAAIVIRCWGWNWADGAMSLIVAGLIAITALPLVRQSLHILLEKAPRHLEPAVVTAHLQSFEGVIAVQALRIWTIALGQEALTADLTVSYTSGQQRDRLLYQLQTSLQQNFGIAEIYLQLSAGPAAGFSDLISPSILEQIEANQR